MKRTRYYALALAAALTACGGGGDVGPGGGFDAQAPLTATAVAEGVPGPAGTSRLSDAAPEAILDGSLVLVRGSATTPLANGSIVTELFLTFPTPGAGQLPAVFRFDDPLLGGPIVYGRFDLVSGGERDEHESLRDGEQPAGSGFIVVTALEEDRVAGTFSFRAAVVGEHHEAAAEAKHGPPDVGHGDERLTVAGAFDAPLSLGEISYPRAGEDEHPHTDAAPSRVEVAFIHHKSAVMGVYPDPIAGGEPRVFTNDLGLEITLAEAQVAVESVSLLPCEEEEHEDAAAAKHGEGEPEPGEVKPLVLEVAGIVDYVGFSDLVARSKTFAAPNQAYCGAEVAVRPIGGAHADVKHGEGARPALHVVGECREGGEVREFDAETDEARAVTLHFHRHADGGNVEAPLVPRKDDYARAEDGDAVQDLVVGTSYNALFQGLDCMTATDEEIAAYVLGKLAGASPAMHPHGGRIDAFASF